jgi:hypothetical protein
MSVDVSQSAKAIELQLEEPIGMVEGVGDADQGHGVKRTLSASQTRTFIANPARPSSRNPVGQIAFLESAILVYKGDRHSLNNQPFLPPEFS